MKSAFFTLGILFLLSGRAAADYHPLTLLDLAGQAEVIAVGSITKLHEQTYEFVVEDSIVGAIKQGQLLTVQQFHDWPCAWRWSEYQVGEQLLVFLTRDEPNEQWRALGAGCEGESPLVLHEVHTHVGLEGRPVEYEARIGTVQLSAVSWEQLRRALVDFRANYRVTMAENPWRKTGKFSKYIPFTQIATILPPKPRFPPRRPTIPFVERSPIHWHLAELVDRERDKIAEYRTE